MSMIDERITAISDCLYRVTAKIIVTDNGKLLATIEPNGKYGLPGGGIDHGETIPEALERELMEELRLSKDHVTIESLPVFITNDAVTLGIPKMAIFFKAQLHNPEAVQHADVRYEWIDAKTLETVTLANSVKGARAFLLSQLRGV